MSLLSAHDLSYHIDQTPLLNSIDFNADEGQFIGLIGPNGAGKSTLLKLLAGVLQPSRGQVLLAQRTLRDWPANARAKKLAFLAQQEQPAWSVTAQTLVALGRLPYVGSTQVALKQDAGLIRMALAAAGVEPLALRSVDTLSGGELRRVQCARLFATVADVWLADEPIAALDPLHQIQIMELLKTKSQTGLVIAALHDLNLSARFCDRLLLIANGQLIADGTPSEVLNAENLARVYGIRADIVSANSGLAINNIQPISNAS